MKQLSLSLGLIAACCAVFSLSLAHAETPASAIKSTVSKPAAKPVAKRSAAKTPVAKAAPAPAPEPEADLGESELAIATQVDVGNLPCELGASVQLQADPARPGYFNLQIQKNHYRMIPVITSTGAVRLEDSKSGTVWLQLANKSMLMNHKLGQRMADECKSERQEQVAERFKTDPPPSVLEPTPQVIVPLAVPAEPQVPAAATPADTSDQ